MKKKDQPDVPAKNDDDDDELQDTYKEDKPPEKAPDPTTKPVWRPPASRQQMKSLTEKFPYDLRESWCELRMYICSTGDDFFSERMAVTNALLPELQVRCASRRIRISAVDCWNSTGLSTRLKTHRLCNLNSFTIHLSPHCTATTSLLLHLQLTPMTSIYLIASGKSTAAPSSSLSAGGALVTPFLPTCSRQNCDCYPRTMSFLRSLLTP
jgi:hypothetical protein